MLVRNQREICTLGRMKLKMGKESILDNIGYEMKRVGYEDRIAPVYMKRGDRSESRRN